MQSYDIALENEASTRRLGAVVAHAFRAGGFVGLVGELGAGKTTLVQGLLGAIDTSLEASSPTYTLLNVYETTPPIYHFDLYRLQTLDDLESVGYWDHVEEVGALSCVEWIDQVEGAWNGQGVLITLEYADKMRTARLQGDHHAKEIFEVYTR